MQIVGEEDPRVAAGIDDVVAGVEDGYDGYGELVGAQAGPDVPDRVQFRAVGRQGQQQEVVGDDKAG